MLELIEILNFKSSLDIKIRLKQLTILSGLNGAGKSSVLQSLAIIKQNLTQKNRPGRINFNGSYISLGMVPHLLNRTSSNEIISFTFEGQSGEINTWEIFVSGETGGSARCKLTGAPELFQKMRRATIQYLAADRMMPKFYYERSDINNGNYLGVRGENTPAFLASRGSDKLSGKRWPVFQNGEAEADMLKRLAPTRRLLDGTAAWLQYLCPGTSVKAAVSEIEEVVSLSYSTFTSDPLSVPADVRPPNIGFGLTYVLPVIVACLSAPRDSILLLENPEAHLHPKGQLALGYLVSQCSQDGVQIITETHSDHFINGVRLAARQGLIPADAVAFRHFARDLKTGNSYVQSPPMQQDGTINDWPDGFFDEWEKALEQLVF